MTMLWAWTPLPAAAIANDVQQTCTHTTSNLTYRFVGSGWTPNRMDAAQEAMAEWSSVRGYNAAPIVTFSQVAFPSDLELTVAMTAEDTLGQAFCFTTGSHEIRISPNAADSYTKFKNVVRHEIGHGMGLQHTGSTDNIQEPANSTMSTCVNPLTLTLSMDDRSALALSRNQLGERGFSANGGFESGTAFFKDGAGTTAWTPSGGTVGPAHVLFSPSQWLWVSARRQRQCPAAAVHHVDGHYRTSDLRPAIGLGDPHHGNLLNRPHQPGPADPDL